MEKLFEINYHEYGGVLLDITVTPIRVIKRGIAEGCTKESMLAISHDGHKFHGNPDAYFKTEDEAWEHVRTELFNGIAERISHIESLQNEQKKLETLLANINKNRG